MGKFDKEELRQRAAIAAMQSLVAKCKDGETSYKQLAMREVLVDGEKKIRPFYNRDWIAEEAVAYADALVDALCLEEEK